MLCLSRDLRAFSRFSPVRGAALRCMCFSGVCGGCLAADCHGGGVGRARSRPQASVSPEGVLARRQLSAAAGRQSPWGAGRLLFQACCRARSTGVRPPPLASFGDIALGVLELCLTPSSPKQGSTTRRRRFRAARLFHRCRRCQITTRASYWTPRRCLLPAKMPSYRPSLGNLGGFCAFLARTRSVRTFLWCRSTAVTRPPGPRGTDAENPR